MEVQLNNSNKKREHDEDDNNDQNERKKPDVLKVADATTNITDVNDDCLEHIFKHLLLRDLINVADTCKQFQASAQSTFAAKYKGKSMSLCYGSCTNRFNAIKLYGNTIYISELLSCLKVLRQFGSKISTLSVDYFYVNENQKAELARYMNEFCADTLINIGISGVTECVLANWTKPFSNAEKLDLWGSALGDLSVWFPKMRYLILRDEIQCITKTLPHLEGLKIHTYGFDYPKASIAKILRLNPHLKIFQLFGTGYDMIWLESISGYLQYVQSLIIQGYDQFFNHGAQSIHLKSVKNFHFILRDEITKIPFTFDHLEKVQLEVDYYNFAIDDDIVNFIRRNSSLTKLTFYISNHLMLAAEQMKINLNAEFDGLDVKFIPHVTSGKLTEDMDL